MSYVKQNFAQGQILTAEALNTIEDGIEQAHKNPLKGLKVSIMGDSISTYEGWLKSGYPTWYPKADVTDVGQTWWKKLIDDNEMILGFNASYSGSGVQSDAWGTSAITDERINLLGQNGDPDIIIFYIGTNDNIIENLSELGDIDTLIDTPMTNSSANKYDTTTFLGAYQAMITKAMYKYPNAKIVCMGLLWRVLYDFNNGDVVNSADLFVAANKISQICDLYGGLFIDPRKCGITPANMSSYLIDGLHPNAAGHQLIANYVKTRLIYEHESYNTTISDVSK